MRDRRAGLRGLRRRGRRGARPPAEPPRPRPPSPRRPHRRPTPASRRPTTAAQQRRQPGDQLGHGRPRRRHDHGRLRPGALPRRARARRRPSRSSGQLDGGTVSGNLVVRFAGPDDLLASGPPAGGRPAREPRPDPLQGPRRHLDSRRTASRRPTTTSSRSSATSSSPSRPSRPTSRSAATAARSWETRTPPGGADRRRRQPGDPRALGGLDRAGHVRLDQRRPVLAPARHDVRRAADLAERGRALQRRSQRAGSRQQGRRTQLGGPRRGRRPAERSRRPGERMSCSSPLLEGRSDARGTAGERGRPPPLCADGRSDGCGARRTSPRRFAGSSPQKWFDFRSKDRVTSLIGLSLASPVRGLPRGGSRMKGISRRTRACAVVAVTGVAVLAGAGAAQAQRPASVGDGVPTGQVERAALQLRRLHQHRRQHGRGEPDPRGGRQPAADGTQCLTSQRTGRRRPPAIRPLVCSSAAGTVLTRCSSSCPARASTASSSSATPACRPTTTIAGLRLERLPRAARQVQPARRRLARQPQRDRLARARHRRQDHRPATTSATGNGLADGTGLDSYDSILRSAEALNRLGKYSVENGVGPVYIHNHTGEFDTKYVDNGVLKYRLGHPDRAHRPALRRVPGRRLLVLRRVRRSHRRGDRGLHQQVPDAREADARQGRHQHDGAVQPQPDQQPRRLAARLRHR